MQGNQKNIKNKGEKSKARVLSFDVALAFKKRIFEGKPVLPHKKDPIVLEIQKDGDITYLELSWNTVSSWLQRNVRIPETGELFSEWIIRAKEEYKRIALEQKKEGLISVAEKMLLDVLNIEENEEVFEKDIPLIKEKVGVAKFILDRFGGDEWKKDKTVTAKPIFSLSELRKLTEKQRYNL